MAKRQIVDIVEALISQLGFTIKITNNVDNGGGNHVLSMSNTYYLTKLKEIVIDGFDYEVTDFVFNESITVKPIANTNTITVETFDLPAPLFFHGTVKSTDVEVGKEVEKNKDTFPIVYLFENIKETFISDKSQLLERTSPIQLFFLDMSNYDDNLNKDFLEEVLKPLSNLEEEFFKVLEKEKGIAKLTSDYDRMNLAKFARTDTNGETLLIFSQELSGIELDLTLPILKC